MRLYYPELEPWVAQSASIPAVRPVYLCANVGPRGATHCSACPVLCHSESGPLNLSVCECGATGSASGQTACPVCPTLRQSWFHHANASLLCSGCPSPPLLPVWMNVYFLFPWCWTSLPFDFQSVLVVRGGAVCLPTPPSWFSGLRFSYMLEYCWLFALFLRSARRFTGAKGKWTPLPPISPPSSPPPKMVIIS